MVVGAIGARTTAFKTVRIDEVALQRHGITAETLDLSHVFARMNMYALHLASGEPATCLDWNNNYGEADDKCILFHCGPVRKGLMTDRGRIADHAILANAVGEGCSYGCRVSATPGLVRARLREAVEQYVGLEVALAEGG